MSELYDNNTVNYNDNKRNLFKKIVLLHVPRIGLEVMHDLPILATFVAGSWKNKTSLSQT